MKIDYENPEFISMSDQTVQDVLEIKLDNVEILGTNGLPLDIKNLPLDENGNPLTMKNIQPMVNEAKSEINNL